MIRVLTLIAVFAMFATMSIPVVFMLLTCLVIAIGMYCAYYYKGTKNYWLSLGVLGSFILFMASSVYPGGYICTLLLLVFIGEVFYFAWHAQKEEVKPKESSMLMRYEKECPSCHKIIGAEFSFCPACGAKQ